jgi:hypothetical protein
MASRSSAGENVSKHVWKFVRTGGLDQVRFETAADFLDLGNLDQKLWVALSGPTRGLHFDERTLALVDADGDGRIRTPELIAAVQWACQHLKDPGVLAQGSAALPLSATRPMPSFIATPSASIPETSSDGTSTTGCPLARSATCK